MTRGVLGGMENTVKQWQVGIYARVSDIDFICTMQTLYIVLYIITCREVFFLIIDKQGISWGKHTMIMSSFYFLEECVKELLVVL